MPKRVSIWVALVALVIMVMAAYIGLTAAGSNGTQPTLAVQTPPPSVTPTTSPTPSSAPMVESFVGPSFVVDTCKVDKDGNLIVGGKVGPDSKIGQSVFVSKGDDNTELNKVNANGTFEDSVQFVGSTDVRDLIGEEITVAIRPEGGDGAWLVKCMVKRGK